MRAHVRKPALVVIDLVGGVEIGVQRAFGVDDQLAARPAG